jgi:hypothetical protein
MSQNNKCSVERDRVKSVLHLNIILKTPSDPLHGRPGLHNMSINCHKTPETETIYK